MKTTTRRKTAKVSPPPAKKIPEGDLVKVLYVFFTHMEKSGIWYCACLQLPATTSVHVIDISEATFVALMERGVEEITREQHHARWAGKAAVL